MITLGCCDADTSNNERNIYLQLIKQLTRLEINDVIDGRDKLTFQVLPSSGTGLMKVKMLQQALTTLGFFPGGKADGICGYRTHSAIRLFQEYVRSIEKLPCTPDGIFGSKTQGHLQRWLTANKRPDWAADFERWQAGEALQSEYTQWLELLDAVKTQSIADPGRELELVNAYSGTTDTKPVKDWDFDPAHIHLIGIRSNEFSGKFDDIFILLIRGLVFKFQGSTEPGASSHPKGRPYLVQGQHDYHFGWHRKSYLALRPLGKGVLVVRSQGDTPPDETDLDNGLEANATINIHWGGKGGAFNVSTWSEGCQVINGSIYSNHKHQLVDCSGFVARNNTEVNQNAARTRGAYNVLQDLIVAFSGDTATQTVKYMLLLQSDLDLDTVLRKNLADIRKEAYQRLKG
jgi:hypothetical protein